MIECKALEFTVYPDGRMDVQNAAAYLKLSPKTLAMMRCQGTGPKYTKRGRVFYYLDDLDEWMKAGRTRSTAEARLLKKEVQEE